MPMRPTMLFGAANVVARIRCGQLATLRRLQTDRVPPCWHVVAPCRFTRDEAPSDDPAFPCRDALRCSRQRGAYFAMPENDQGGMPDAKA